jgi:hypothetical protein
MAAPRFAPVSPVEEVRTYESPEHIPDTWQPSRPADITGRQPVGPRLGYQGPDQGYVLTLAKHMRTHVVVTSGEDIDDALRGCSLIALRRASLYGRAPVMADLELALTIWGFLDANAPSDLVAARKPHFEGVRNTLHHYAEARELADLVPESTLRLTPGAARTRMPADWRALTGA